MHNAALVLIDLQNDFLALPRLEPHPDTIIAGATRLIEVFRNHGLPVAYVRTRTEPNGSGRMPHWEQKGIFACADGTSGYDGPVSLTPRADEPVFDKTFFSAFSVPAFENYLRERKIETLVIGGLYLQTCLRQTALDAYQNGFSVCIAREATGTHDPLHGALTLDYLADRAIPSFNTAALVAGIGTEAKVHSPFFEPKPAYDTLLSSVRSVQSAWAREPMPNRVERLRLLAARLELEKEGLAQVIVAEVKKPIAFARGEVDRAVALLKVVTARVEKFSETKTEAEGRIGYKPRGVVAMITPWNNPLAIPMGKLAPALVYGNGVMWKPSPFAPKVAGALLPLLAQSGIPQGLVQIVEGDDRHARALIASGVDAVAFSGSSRTGWSVVSQASARLLPLQAELGGNNAAIVCATADFKAAADAIAEGAFGFAGQRCTSNRRVIVLSGIFEAFLRQLEKSTLELPCGDPLKIETRVTPMISLQAAQATAVLVERARVAGFRALQPHLPQQNFDAFGGAFYPPTIILCEDAGSFIVQEESFGPILVVQKARDFEHALQLLNQVPYGLVAALFSQDKVEQETFLQSAQAGIVKLNSSTVNAGVDLPFTGWKHSGYGSSEHGEANAEFFTKRQAIYG
jgi:alpha-ketoglutaric semialdehyde dehydrogenase